MSKKRQYWLMKSEPDVFSIADLFEQGSACWEGVRNYQARNFMKDMKAGDLVLFYHSNAEPSGVAGVARVAKEAYPDHFAFDPKSKYYDPKSDPDAPTWFMVDVEPVETFAGVLSLRALKEDPKLEGMRVTQKGSRLSVQPVESEHFQHVVRRGRKIASAPVEPSRSSKSRKTRR